MNFSEVNANNSDYTTPAFGFPPMSVDRPQDAKTEKEVQSDLGKPISPVASVKAMDKSNVHVGLKNQTANKNEVKTANLNGTNYGEENGQFSYDDIADTDASFTGGISKVGVPSMFNNYSIFIHSLCNQLNDFKDIAGTEGVFNHVKDKPEMTLAYLLDAFSPEKSVTCPYYANDFLYSKYYNKIPLNHLITLRRFPFPTYDSLEFAEEGEFRPLAQAVTYFGEPTGNQLSQIFKINGKINWKSVSAQVWDVESQDNKSLDDTKGIFSLGAVNTKSSVVNNITNTTVNIANKGVASGGQAVDIVNNNGDLSGKHNAGLSAARASVDFSYTHKVYGPINVIKDTMTRDTGIGGDLSFSLVFEYQLKSYNNINPKLAFLDLINNLLALTYFHAKWWGGANRFFPKPMSKFGFLGDQKAFYNGDYGKYFESVGSALQSAGNGILSALGGLWDAIMTGNFSAIANMVMNGASKVLDMKSRKSRPNAVSVHSLVSGAPVGEYHLVIGNPQNPIATIGNLIMQDFSIELGDRLGFDDFPDSLKLKVNMKRARSSDSGDWQSMLNVGSGRTYVPESGMPDLVNQVANSTTMVNGKKTRSKSAQGISRSFGSAN